MADFDIDKKLLDKLTKTFIDAELTDLEFKWGDRRIRMRQKAPNVIATSAVAPAAPAPVAAPAAAPASAGEAVGAGAAPADLSNAVVSPMVGTAYLSPEPGKPAFVSIGDKVSAGQTLLIIEAMKVMNPLESPKAGKVVDILVADSEPVEFGQPLVVIE